MLKLCSGILGLLGALLGLSSAFLSIEKGLHTESELGVGFLAVGIIVAACAVICLGLSIGIFATGGRVAGVLMILPALAGSIFTYGLMSFALKGAILASIWGETKQREENYETRQSRLEKEVQQRYGARG